MRVYDIALMFMRASAALGFLRGGVDFAMDSIRLVALPLLVGRGDTAMLQAFYLMTPAAQLFVALIILMASKPLARFAAKLSSVSDAAAPF